jgi:hypothetical protein
VRDAQQAVHGVRVARLGGHAQVDVCTSACKTMNP